MTDKILPFTKEQIAQAMQTAKSDGRFFVRNIPESHDVDSALDNNIDVFKRLKDR